MKTRKILSKLSSRQWFWLLGGIYYLILILMMESLRRFRFIFTLEREHLSVLKTLLMPLSSLSGVILTLLGFILIGLLIPHIRSYLIEDEDKKFKLSKDKTYGDAAIAGLKTYEKDDAFSLTNTLKENSGILLGRKQNKVVSIRCRRGNNENGLIIGTSGSGKTSSFILPNIINTIKRRESFLTIDPKGELFRKTVRRLKREGYKINVLNFKSPQYSDSFNLLEGVQAKQDSIYEKTETIFVNLGYNNPGSEFFEEGSQGILAFLLAVSVEVKQRVESGEIDPPVLRNGFKPGTLGFALDLLYGYQGSENVSDHLKKLVKQINRSDPENFSQEFWKLIAPGERTDLLENYLANFKRISSYFFDKDITRIFSGDDFKIDDGLREKTAYFLIMNESSTSKKNRLASIFINTLMVRFEALKDNYPEDYPQTFRFILDEFGAIGNINGFENILSGCRSRDMSVLFAVQDITQLKNNYRGVYDSIQGNCSLILTTGARDDPSRSLISELLGITTIDKKTLSQSKDGRTSVTTVPTERSLVRKDELLEQTRKVIGIYNDTRFILDQLRYYEEALEDEGETVENYFKTKGGIL